MGGPWTDDPEARPCAHPSLHVEAELHDVAVLHDVVLALDPGLAGRAGLGDRAGLDQVVVADDLGLDEALLEVGVDDAGGLGAVAPLWIVQARDSFGPAVR